MYLNLAEAEEQNNLIDKFLFDHKTVVLIVNVSIICFMYNHSYHHLRTIAFDIIFLLVYTRTTHCSSISWKF